MLIFACSCVILEIRATQREERLGEPRKDCSKTVLFLTEIYSIRYQTELKT